MTRDRSLNFPHARAAAPVAGSAKSSKARGRTLQQLLKLPLLLLMLLPKPPQLLLPRLPVPHCRRRHYPHHCCRQSRKCRKCGPLHCT